MAQAVSRRPRRPGFDPGLVHVAFVVDKVALGQAFPRVLRFSPASLLGKGQTIIIIIIFIFITGLHNKPQGCGKSVASAGGPSPLKKKFPCPRYEGKQEEQQHSSTHS
jgi:hypothetical protein